MVEEKKEPYFGRGIVLGLTPDNWGFAAYFLTGRSPPSRARVIEIEGNRISTKPTDEAVLAQGDTNLLLYDVATWDADQDQAGFIALSNGNHTGKVVSAYQRGISLREALKDETFEPDPLSTPRIAGLMEFSRWDQYRFRMAILRKGQDGSREAEEFDFPIKPGEAEKITTYAGPNTNPITYFQGFPPVVEVRSSDLEGLANEMEQLMGHPEHRVGLAVALRTPKGIESMRKNYQPQ